MRPRSAPSASAIPSRITLTLGVLILLHALLTPGAWHLALEEPGCPHPVATATAQSAAADHLCPPPTATAPLGEEHPEHNPALRSCTGTAAAAISRPGDRTPLAADFPAPPTNPALTTAGLARPRLPMPSATGRPGADSGEILRC